MEGKGILYSKTSLKVHWIVKKEQQQCSCVRQAVVGKSKSVSINVSLQVSLQIFSELPYVICVGNFMWWLLCVQLSPSIFTGCVCVCVSEAGDVPDFSSRDGADLRLALLLNVPSQRIHSAQSAGVHLQCGHRQHVPIATLLPGTAPIHYKHSTAHSTQRTAPM